MNPAIPQPHTPAHPGTEPAERHQQDSDKSRQHAETEEVAGRHKNDGQKDHKGAK
ncbi:MAG: hypothetical protein ACEQSK_06460 [Sphingomonadaceae bacterium]